jgi:monoamine oxidase
VIAAASRPEGLCVAIEFDVLFSLNMIGLAKSAVLQQDLVDLKRGDEEMMDIHEQLARISAADEGRPRKKILILGAGMSGLVAGYELKKLGHSVRILEGSNRAGGRVHTRRFSDGTHGELGAMRIPLNHHYTRYYVKQMGLTLRKFVSAHDNLECFYDIRGTITRMKDAPKNLYPKFDLSRDQVKKPIPTAMFSEAMDQLVRSLTDSDRAYILSNVTNSKRLLEMDRRSLREFLCERAGYDAANLIGLSTGLESLFDRGITMFLRDVVADEGAGLDEIAEGMDALPTRLAGFLRDEIEFEVEVDGIWVADGGAVRITGRRGDVAFETISSDPIICTLPFTVLRSMRNGVHLSAAKERAVRDLGYTSATKVLLHTVERFWETKYGIYGGASQTDTAIRALYYPSAFVRIVAAGRSTSQFRSLYTGYTGGQFAPEGAPVAGGVLLGSYTWGADAKRIGALPPAHRKDLVITQIARIHPEIASVGMVDDYETVFWDDTRWMRGGTFSFLEPTQQYELVAEASRPEGNLHFAGEHCSLDNAWIQGAATSALNAIERIVSYA